MTKATASPSRRRVALTDRYIKSLKPPSSGEVEIADDVTRGLRLRVTSAGTRTFAVVRQAGGRRHRVTLGNYPAMDLKKAREAALTSLSRIGAGEDVTRQRRREKEIKRGATLADVLDEYPALHPLRTWDQMHREIRGTFGSLFSLPVATITAGDLQRCIDAKRKSGAHRQAAKTWAYLRAVLKRRANAYGLDPALPHAVSVPSAVRRRSRTLSDDEIRLLWGATEAAGTFGQIVRFLILTGQRRGPVIEMRWQDLDRATSRWAAGTHKHAKASHEIILPRQARDLLSGLGGAWPDIGDSVVFATRTGTPYASNWHRGWTRLLRAAGFGESADLRAHDLRRTWRTLAARVGVRPEVGERVLDHVTGAASRVERIYNHYGYQEEMADALQRVADLINTIVEDRVNVVPLSRPLAS